MTTGIRSSRILAPVAALVVLLLSGPALATGPGTIVASGAAPYLGGTLFHLGRVVTAGCATGVSDPIPNGPSFNTTTGVGRFADGVVIKSCAGLPNTTQAFHYLDAGVGNLSFTIPTNGSYNISTNWSAKGAFDYNISYSGPLPNRSSQSGGLFMGHGFCIRDLTASGPSQCRYWHVVISKSFFHGTGRYAFSWTNQTRSGHWKFVGGHRYAIEAFVVTELEAYTSGGIPSGSITLKLDLYSRSNFGATLNSYAIFS